MAKWKAAPDPEKRATPLTQAFIEKVAAVFGVSVESVQAKYPLSSYGLDSIVAVEFCK